jgi:hypothetical protein
MRRRTLDDQRDGLVGQVLPGVVGCLQRRQESAAVRDRTCDFRLPLG